MSPNAIRTLQAFARSMAIVGFSHETGNNYTVLYGDSKPKGGWLPLFKVCQRFENDGYWT